MFLASLLTFLRPPSLRPPTKRRRASCRLQVERLEERDCPSGSYLLVTDASKHNVLRYDGATGAFVDEFVARKSGDLNEPYGVIFGPDHQNLYVSSGHLLGTGPGNGRLQAVLRYDGVDGKFLGVLPGGVLDQPHTLIFGPDGNLYVGDRPGGNWKPQGGRIVRLDGTTGAFLDEFVPLGSDGLKHPSAHVFGPDSNGDGHLDLYVSDEGPSRVLHYDGVTGAFLGEFVTTGSGGMIGPAGLTFGPDGNLYVADWGTSSVMRFQGPSGPTPGAPMPSLGNSGADFIPYTGFKYGIRVGGGLIFGPDGNGDGQQDLYVTYGDYTGQAKATHGSVRRYDGVTGAFIDDFVTPRSGGLENPYFLTFTETDPTTLAYTGAPKSPSAAASSPAQGAGLPPHSAIDATTISYILLVSMPGNIEPVLNTHWQVDPQPLASDANRVRTTQTQRPQLANQAFTARLTRLTTSGFELWPELNVEADMLTDLALGWSLR